MEKFPALERPTSAIFNFFFRLVTDENSESDSDTEEKLKGEKSCCAGCVLVTGEVQRWPCLLSVRGDPASLQELAGQGVMSETGQGGPVRSLSLWLHSRDSGTPCPRTYPLRYRCSSHL